MPKTTVPATAEGMPKTTRRAFLSTVAVAAIPVTAGACVAVTAIQADAAAPALVAENPDLLAAYARLQDAQAELRDAKDALEWIADEWRHKWPLAPEELLGVSGADRYLVDGKAETDIIGNFVYRDCRTLTKRLSPQFRKIELHNCFSVTTSNEAQNWLEDFQQRRPRGRTPEALAKSQEAIDRNIREYGQRVDLAKIYEAETARLRTNAGVEEAKQRINNAEADIAFANNEISKIPAFTYEGLVIKAEAIKASGVFEAAKRGVAMEVALLLQQIIDMGGRVLA